MAGCCKVCLNRGVFWSEKEHHITVKVSYPTWVDIEQSLFDSQALQYHCFHSISTKNPNKKKMRFTSLPTKSQSSPSPISPHHFCQGHSEITTLLSQCADRDGDVTDLHISWTLKWCVKSYVLGVKWFFHGSVEIQPWQLKSIDVILNIGPLLRHWGVPNAATLVWPPGGNNRLLVGIRRCCWYILFPKCVCAFNAKLGWESVEMLYVGKLLLLHLLTCMGSLSFKCPL